MKVAETDKEIVMRDCCKETVAKVKEDEPVFMLRGQDLLARYAVERWIEDATRCGVSKEKIERAKCHLQDIIDFQAAHKDRCKFPD